MLVAIAGLLGYSALQVVGYRFLLPHLEKAMKEGKGLGKGLLSVLFGPALAFNSIFKGAPLPSNGKEFSENLEKIAEAENEKALKDREKILERANVKYVTFRNGLSGEQLDEVALEALRERMINLINDEKNLGKSESDIFGGIIEDWLDNNYKELTKKDEPDKKDPETVLDPLPGSVGPNGEPVTSSSLSKVERDLLIKIEDYMKLYKIVVNSDSFQALKLDSEKVHNFYYVYEQLGASYELMCKKIETRFASEPEKMKELLKEARINYEISILNFFTNQAENIPTIEWIGSELEKIKAQLENKKSQYEDAINTGMSMQEMVNKRKELSTPREISDPKIKALIQNPTRLARARYVSARLQLLLEKKKAEGLTSEETEEYNNLTYDYAFIDKKDLEFIENNELVGPYLDTINQLASFKIREEDRKLLDQIHEKLKEYALLPLNDVESRSKLKKEIAELKNKSSFYNAMPDVASKYLRLKKKLDTNLLNLSCGTKEAAIDNQNEIHRLIKYEKALIDYPAVEEALVALSQVAKHHDGPKAHLMPFNEMEKALGEFVGTYGNQLDSRYRNIRERYQQLADKLKPEIKTAPADKVKPAVTSPKTVVKVSKYVIDEEKLKAKGKENLTTGQEKIIDCLNQLFKDGIAPTDIFDRRSLNSLIKAGIITETPAGEREFDTIVYRSCAIYSKPIYLTENGTIISKSLNGKLTVKNIVKKELSQETLEKVEEDLRLALEGKKQQDEVINLSPFTR